uniref:Uncharacterized protein n=1 Tax=Otus sunia TaxID=257818 RepID=A0A8C8B526_9STRI
PLGGCPRGATPGARGPDATAQHLWAGSAWPRLLWLPLSCLSPGGRWERQMARGRRESRAQGGLSGDGSRLWAFPFSCLGLGSPLGHWGQQDRGRASSGGSQPAGKQAEGFNGPVLNSGGLGGMDPALPSPRQRCVLAEGGGGSAPAQEWAPETVLGTSWQCRGSLLIALAQC